MRTVLTALTALTLTAPASAQVASPPTGLATLELERSRTCVGVIARVERLDEALAPHAQRAQRLLGISEAIALEDDRVVEQLDTSDPVEAQVQAWFTADQELAQRYVATLPGAGAGRRAHHGARGHQGGRRERDRFRRGGGQRAHRGGG